MSPLWEAVCAKVCFHVLIYSYHSEGNSDELDYHTQQCERRIWNGTTSDLFPAFAGFDTSKNHEGGTGLTSSISTEAESNVPSPSSLLAGSFPCDLFSPAESRQCPEDDQEFSDFLSSFASVPPPDMPPLPEMSFYDARQPRGHLHPNISRPGSSASMVRTTLVTIAFASTLTISVRNLELHPLIINFSNVDSRQRSSWAHFSPTLPAKLLFKIVWKLPAENKGQTGLHTSSSR
ncbi:hypothetical protein Hypma_003155 [Hypsizygus marmoreus]|uniref:Uncharacterized protein n=1 Tax=Hypsizygus marmoreus TaxID=39966 RepID=A0A369K7F0_HYPMA|nr:hypothetical protein Hypma_003155 [Hypsizygus marmoreus]